MSGTLENKKKQLQQNNYQIEKKAPQSLINMALLLLSAIMFSLSFPSFINSTGFSFLAYFALFPAFAVTYRMKWIAAPFFGLFLGLVSYAIFNYWLSSFFPLTIFIVPLLYATYYFFLFPVLKISDTLFIRKSYIINSIIWVGYEYLRTKGFLGYSYGIIGYTQYLFPPLVRVSSLTGIWGVSLLVIFPSAFLGYVFKDGFKDWLVKLKKTVIEEKIVLIIYALIFIAALFYGSINTVDVSKLKTWKVSLIQHNIDPWQGGYATYRESLTRLKRLSEKAALDSPDIIIWSETSFVPAIDWHTKYRPDPKMYELVKELKDFLATQTIPYLIGNDEGVLITDEKGENKRIDYNAALLFEPGGKHKGTYRKTHLVPFTEHFPYKKQVPFLYKLLEEADTHFWEKGKEYTVFEIDSNNSDIKIKFSTPICFEDTFGYISREFVLNGANVIVNITNDSWSGSIAAEVQHMMHAVFRAAENQRSVVRSTNGGITCIIDPNGKITSRIDPFIESFLTGEVPVNNSNFTLYTKIGDLFGIIFVILSISFILLKLAIFYKKIITKP
ncbi:MAG: apolipoprotein N-acyltransferase [Spirochaetaceae bacterium]|nr:apolipoprotein N-acyltransferase [Spirochaetaceae bacterium]